MSGAGDAKKSFAVLGAAGNVLALKDHFEDALFSARTVHGSRVAWVVHLPDEALLATHPRAPGRRPTSRVELVAEVEAAPLDLLAKPLAPPPTAPPAEPSFEKFQGSAPPLEPTQAPTRPRRPRRPRPPVAVPALNEPTPLLNGEASNMNEPPRNLNAEASDVHVSFTDSSGEPVPPAPAPEADRKPDVSPEPAPEAPQPYVELTAPPPAPVLPAVAPGPEPAAESLEEPTPHDLVWEQLGPEGRTVDELVAATGLPRGDVLRALSDLWSIGDIERPADRWFRRKR